MTINPDDLLIFKKRKASGSSKDKEEAKDNKEQQKDNNNTTETKQQTPNNAVTTPNVDAKPTQTTQSVESSQQTSTTNTQTTVNNENNPVSTAPKQESQVQSKNIKPAKPPKPMKKGKAEKNKVQTTPSKPKTQEEVLSEKLFQNKSQSLDNGINQKLSKESNSLNLGKTNEYSDLEKNLLTEKDLMTTGTISTSNLETVKEDINKTHSVNGLSCINHPWRSAYALCNYCHRPFCYADLAKENNKNYCLEDLDQITKTQTVLVKKDFIYDYVASIFLFAVAGIFLFYAYQQIHYTTLNFFNSLFSLGLIPFIKTLSLSYIYQLQNPLIVLFSVIAGILLLVKREKATITSALILVIISMVLSYTFLISNTYYFLYSFISCVVCMSIIALGKMNNIGSLHVAEVTEGIEWPRVETF